jgi:glycosyltransferase involved in cell wall biosynthesis
MAREFTRALDRALSAGDFPGVEVKLLVPTAVDPHGLGLRAIEICQLPGYQRHLWEQLTLPRKLGDAWLLNLGNTAPFTSLLRGKRLAVVIHDLSYRVFPTAYRLRYRLSHFLLDYVLMKRVRLLITVADTERDAIARFYPRTVSKMIVAQNGGWHDDDHSAPPIALGERSYGLYVGSISRRKNIDAVLTVAVALARSRGLKFKIVGASSPILAELSLDIPSDLRSSIEICGQVDDTASLRELYQNAAFLLFPSFYEASALPPMEAMALGCPVIVSDIPALRERCGDAALYCDPADLRSILAATERLLDDRALAEQLISRGRSLAHTCSWEAQVKKIIAAIELSDAGALPSSQLGKLTVG